MIFFVSVTLMQPMTMRLYYINNFLACKAHLHAWQKLCDFAVRCDFDFESRKEKMPCHQLSD
jgi:hypothetical protein